MNTLEWLQDWYRSNCDEEWEHSYGISIETLDNPGWSVSIDLVGTPLADKTFSTVRWERSTNDWGFCDVKDSTFLAHGGPQNLTEILEMFKHWSEGNTKANNFVGDLNVHCPLSIEKVSYDGTSLSLSGEDWNFNSTSFWRLLDGEKIVTNSEEEDAASIELFVAHSEITRFSSWSEIKALDLNIKLSGNKTIQVFAMDGHEQWVLKLPNSVFVSTPQTTKAADD